MFHKVGGGLGRVSAVGTGLALLSALSFALSGSFAKSLIEAGWTPGAAVTARIVGAALVLLVPVLLLHRSDLRHLPRAAWPVIGYGALGVAGSQLCYFMALSTLPVSVALLIEYSAPVLLVGLAWARTGRRPGTWVLLGSVLAIAGLVTVLDLTGARLDPVGLAWAAGAAVCNAGYFLIAARSVDAIAPLTMTAAGITVAGVGVGGAAVLGVLPIAATFGTVTLAGSVVPWWVPVVGVVLVSTVVAYATGLVAARRLGAQVASFLALAEVLFAVVAAWLLAGEQPGVPQAIGGLVMVAGVVAVRIGSLRDDSERRTRRGRLLAMAVRARAGLLGGRGDARVGAGDPGVVLLNHGADPMVARIGTAVVHTPH